MEKYAIKTVCMLCAAAALSACSPGASSPSDFEASITSAALTAARIVASPIPLDTPTPTEAAQTAESSPTLSSAGSSASRTPTRPPQNTIVYCDDAAFVTDVTIPDGKVMNPGEEFIKTWRIKNTGTCTWTTSYQLVFVSGEAMDGVDTALEGDVGPGETVDVSVNMEAPAAAGSHIGYWRMKNEAGNQFGQLMYVQITVAAAKTESAIPSPTDAEPTETDVPTVTPTEEEPG
ncbi:MAG: hypothetical protein JW929_16455 [Anaerolineales bacterium]|nr:hypothetical protein [Anaerolineales bacterium]